MPVISLVCQWKKMASYDVKTLHYEMKMEEKKQVRSIVCVCFLFKMSIAAKGTGII